MPRRMAHACRAVPSLRCLTACLVLMSAAAMPALAAPTRAAKATDAHLVVRTVKHYNKTIYSANGHVVYMFARDKAGKSTCYGACAKAWPPLLTSGTARVDSALEASKLGTTKRTNGTLQVTYNGHPMYYYEGDKKAAIMCQHANMHGGLWLILKPNGTPNMAAGMKM